MSRFARTLLATLVAIPGLLFVGSTAAFARVDDPNAGSGSGILLPPPSPGSASISFLDRVQWMGAGAGIVLALIVMYVAATVLVSRRQHSAQLRTS